MELIKNTFREGKANGLFGRHQFALILNQLFSLLLLAAITLLLQPETASAVKPKKKRVPRATPAAAAGVASTVAPNSATLLAPDGSQEQAEFSHNLVLSPYAGLPSYVIFRFAKEKPILVRAIFVIDGRLLVIPLSFREKSNDFRGSFPAGFESLNYQFQAAFSDGRTLLSERFDAEARCAARATEAIVANATRYPLQKKMLNAALWLDEELSQLKYAIFLTETMSKEAQ